MTLKTRRILFYSLAAIFPLISAVIIFYSNGWRFDLQSFSINKLGAVFFRKIPAESTVIIEKTQIKFEPTLLSSSLYFANLFPKNYYAKVLKSGYRSWAKELVVKSSFVTEVPPIILIPEKPEFQPATAKEKAEFRFKEKNAADNKKLALVEFNAEVAPLLKEKLGKPFQIEHSPSGKFLSVLNEHHNLYLINKNSLAPKLISENALSAAFSPDNKKIAFITDKKEMVIYNLITEQTAVLNIGIPEKSEFSWHQNSEYLLVKYPDTGLYLLEGNNLPPINLQLIDSKIQKYQYFPEKNSLYLLKGDSLYSFILEE